jgi:acetyl-CoA synthase
LSTDAFLPVPAGPEFEGEVPDERNLGLIFGRNDAPAIIMVKNDNGNAEEDSLSSIECPEEPLSSDQVIRPLAILVNVTGKNLEPEFFPIMECQVRCIFSRIKGVTCEAKGEGVVISISSSACVEGLTRRHLASWIGACFMEAYGSIIESIKVTFITVPDAVEGVQREHHRICLERKTRSLAVTDDSVDTFYSCTMCQSYVPYHVCIIKPEKPGICGAYSWTDARFQSTLRAHGPFQALPKGACLDGWGGEWSGVNKALQTLTSGRVERFSAYSALDYPETSCGCAECIIAIVPEARGFLAVDRSYGGLTPAGMTFGDLMEIVGRGRQVPGLLGIARAHMMSRTFLASHGGASRIVWMPHDMKHALAGADEGGQQPFHGILDKIADERSALDPSSLCAFLGKKGHPALSMPDLIS